MHIGSALVAVACQPPSYDGTVVITLSAPGSTAAMVRIEDSVGRLCLVDSGEEPVEVLHLPGEPDQWHDPTMGEFLVVREFPAGETFEQFAAALEDGQGAACGLQPIQRVDSYFDPERARSYCLYRAANEAILRDAFLWLGLPKAQIRPVQRSM